MAKLAGLADALQVAAVLSHVSAGSLLPRLNGGGVAELLPRNDHM